MKTNRYGVYVLALLLTILMPARSSSAQITPKPCPAEYNFTGETKMIPLPLRPGDSEQRYTELPLGLAEFTPNPNVPGGTNGWFTFSNLTSLSGQWHVDTFTIPVTCYESKVRFGPLEFTTWVMKEGTPQWTTPEHIYGSGNCPVTIRESLYTTANSCDDGYNEGGTGGNGSGAPGGEHYIEMCQYTDHYDGDGTFLYTTEDFCWLEAM